MFYVYLLKCFFGQEMKNYTIYCGYTNDLKRRLSEHKDWKGKKGAKALRRYKGNLELAYFEEYESKTEAMSREWYIKNRMNREQKIKLINGL